METPILPKERTITLKFFEDRIISLTIASEDEEAMRVAANEVNRLYSIYNNRYGRKNFDIKKEELLLFVALHLSFKIEDSKLKRVDKDRLIEIKELLDQTLSPTILTEDME